MRCPMYFPPPDRRRLQVWKTKQHNARIYTPPPDKVFPLDFVDHGRRLPEHEVHHQHAGHLLLDL